MVTALVLVGFALGVFFLATNASVAGEIAQAKHRRMGGWVLFSFLFPVVGPLLVYMLPSKQ